MSRTFSRRSFSASSISPTVRAKKLLATARSRAWRRRCRRVSLPMSTPRFRPSSHSPFRPDPSVRDRDGRDCFCSCGPAGPRFRNAAHSGVSPRPPRRLHRPDDAQAEPCEADGGRHAPALLGPETPAWPRLQKSRRPYYRGRPVIHELCARHNRRPAAAERQLARPCFPSGRDASASRRRTQASAASGRCGSWLRQRPPFVRPR